MWFTKETIHSHKQTPLCQATESALARWAHHLRANPELTLEATWIHRFASLLPSIEVLSTNRRRLAHLRTLGAFSHSLVLAWPQALYTDCLLKFTLMTGVCRTRAFASMKGQAAHLHKALKLPLHMKQPALSSKLCVHTHARRQYIYIYIYMLWKVNMHRHTETFRHGAWKSPHLLKVGSLRFEPVQSNPRHLVDHLSMNDSTKPCIHLSHDVACVTATPSLQLPLQKALTVLQNRCNSSQPMPDLPVLHPAMIPCHACRRFSGAAQELRPAFCRAKFGWNVRSNAGIIPKACL